MEALNHKLENAPIHTLKPNGAAQANSTSMSAIPAAAPPHPPFRFKRKKCGSSLVLAAGFVHFLCRIFFTLFIINTINVFDNGLVQ